MSTFWHFRHCLGSFLSFLAQVRFPVMTIPSLMALLAASVDVNLAMMCAMHWPCVLLSIGLIHLVSTIDWFGSCESLSIFLCSDGKSGEKEVGMYLTTTGIALSLMTAVALKLSMNCLLCSCIQLAG